LFKSESKEVIAYLQGIHHTRKISHMQVNYSSTVDKLSKLQQNIPTYVTSTPSATSNNTLGRRESEVSKVKLYEYQAGMSAGIAKEKDINETKRIYNSACGRKSVVNEVFFFFSSIIT
jgi:hypothetical protein